MKHIFLCIAILITFKSLASAQMGIQNIHEVAQSSGTQETINIASHTTTSVAATVTTGVLSGAFAVEVYNADTSNYINCGFDVSLSTISGNSQAGREIAPRTAVLFQVNPTAIPVRCMTQKVTGTTRATITQLR